MYEDNGIDRLIWIYGPILILCYYLIPIIIPPFNFPNNIPTIPFYVSFLGLFTKLDQEQIYNIYLKDKLEKHGAVKIYFASRWNILVTKPELLVQVFQDEDIFAKSGNQKKIPYSVLSEYTGDNLISSHGETWKLYRDVLTRAIQFPDLQPVVNNSKRFVDLITKKIRLSDNPIVMSDSIQRYSLANITESMLGLDLQLFTDKESIVHEKLKYVKSQIFKPIYLNFPYLDKFPIPSRVKARNAVVEFREYFCELIKTKTQKNGDVGDELKNALNTGLFTQKQFSDNAMIVMIAGHENPQLLLSSLLYVLARYSAIQEELRNELSQIEFDSSQLETCPVLTSIIYETLRMYPPLGQIINRLTTQPVKLGNISLPKGVYVGYNNFATGRDSNVWSSPNTFQPDRWGVTIEEINRNYAKAKSSARLPAFHGRKRACLGEKFALFEMKQVLNQLLKVYRISLDPNWVYKLTPGGPVCPVQLKLQFEVV